MPTSAAVRAKKYLQEWKHRAYVAIQKTYQRHFFATGKLWPLSEKLFVQAQGHVMWVDELDTLGLRRADAHEPFETELVKKYVGRGDTVVDLGGNIGYYTLLLARLVGPEGRVIVFEPDPTNSALLELNVRMNGYRNVTVEKKAVSDVAASATLYLNETNKGDHQIYDAGEKRRTVAIETVVLDEYLAAHQLSPTFIKMDIQGAEGFALRGMRKTVAAPELTLVTEYWPGGISRSGAQPSAFLDELEKAGFSLGEIDEEHRRVRATSVAELNEQYPPDAAHTDLLCTKRGPRRQTRARSSRRRSRAASHSGRADVSSTRARRGHSVRLLP